MLKVITVTNNHNATLPLLKSLIKHEWDFVCIETEWKGFGTKLISVYNYLKANPEVTEFIFCDAFDVVVCGGLDEFKKKVGSVDFLVSAERGCWPVPDWEKLYPNKFEHGYNYVNSGLYYAKSTVLIGLFESNRPTYETDDQMWLSKHYLDEGIMIKLDNSCDVFQSYSFINEDDYHYCSDGRLFNALTVTKPMWVHGNGRTDMTKVYDLLI